jgi:hypothetical protein
MGDVSLDELKAKIATETFGDASLAPRLRGGNETQIGEDAQKLARAARESGGLSPVSVALRRRRLRWRRIGAGSRSGVGASCGDELVAGSDAPRS